MPQNEEQRGVPRIDLNDLISDGMMFPKKSLAQDDLHARWTPRERFRYPRV